MNDVLKISLLIFITAFQVKAGPQYKEFILTKEFICALTIHGKLKLFDKFSGQVVRKNIPNSSEILMLVNDRFGNLVIADEDKTIKRYDQQKEKWELISKYQGNIFGIVFDSKNHCYLITEKGIEDIQTRQFYFSNISFNHQIHYKDKWEKPYCYCIDKTDRIWLGYGYGEWGGNLFVFNTINKKFLTPILHSFEISLWPIKSFFEDSTFVYLSSGLAHMMTSGTIIRFEDLKASTLLNSASHWSQPTGKDSLKTMIGAEYIGPATFNKFNNSIYFYSQNGIFRGEKSKDLSKIGNWELVLKPKLHWTYGQPDAVGSPMNVLKISIIDKDKFVFLSANDGIGYFDGSKLTMLN